MLFVQIFGVVGVHDELNPFWVVESVAEESEVKFRIVDWMEQLTEEPTEPVVGWQSVTFSTVEEGQELVADALAHPSGGLTSTELIPIV